MTAPPHTPTGKNDVIGVGILITVFTHGILIMAWGLVLCFVVPVFGAMLADFGAALPALTQLVLNLSSFARHYALFVMLGTPIFVTVDGGAYVLARLANRTLGRCWAWLVSGLLVAGMIITVLAMYLPTIRMSSVISS